MYVRTFVWGNCHRLSPRHIKLVANTASLLTHDIYLVPGHKIMLFIQLSRIPTCRSESLTRAYHQLLYFVDGILKYLWGTGKPDYFFLFCFVLRRKYWQTNLKGSKSSWRPKRWRRKNWPCKLKSMRKVWWLQHKLWQKGTQLPLTLAGRRSARSQSAQQTHSSLVHGCPLPKNRLRHPHKVELQPPEDQCMTGTSVLASFSKLRVFSGDFTKGNVV